MFTQFYSPFEQFIIIPILPLNFILFDLTITSPREISISSVVVNVTACPANALSGDVKQLNTCIDYRLTDRSSCQSTCLARKRCPIAKQHQYSEQQLNYQYQQSFETLLSWRS